MQWRLTEYDDCGFSSHSREQISSFLPVLCHAALRCSIALPYNNNDENLTITRFPLPTLLRTGGKQKKSSYKIFSLSHMPEQQTLVPTSFNGHVVIATKLPSFQKLLTTGTKDYLIEQVALIGCLFFMKRQTAVLSLACGFVPYLSVVYLFFYIINGVIFFTT